MFGDVFKQQALLRGNKQQALSQPWDFSPSRMLYWALLVAVFSSTVLGTGVPLRLRKPDTHLLLWLT